MRRTVLFLTACLCLFVAGCQTAPRNQQNPVYKPQRTYPKLEKIVITPSAPKVELGKTVTLKAQGIDSTGDEMADIAPWWTMSEKEKKIGSLNTDEGGEVVFTAKKIGVALINVESNGISASVKVEVVKAAAKAKKPLKK